MSQNILVFIYHFWNGLEELGSFISIASLGVSIAAFCVTIYSILNKEKLKDKTKSSRRCYILIGVYIVIFIVFIVTFISWEIYRSYTEVPDITGENLLDAREKLYQSRLRFDPNTEELIQDSLDVLEYSDYVIETQEPTSGEILHKDSTVSVSFKHRESITEQDKDTSEHTLDENKGVSSSMSTPDSSELPTPTHKPKPNTSKPSTSTPTTDSDNDTNPSTSPSSDPSSNDNANMGGGANVGDFQPVEPSRNDYPEQDVVSGTVSAGF